jgi:hypothetical protein
MSRKVRAQVAKIVTPETLMAWHRKLIAQKYNGSAFRKPGRPQTAHDVADLVIRMAKDNSTWGYRPRQIDSSSMTGLRARRLRPRQAA